MVLRITLVWLIALGLSGSARAEDGYDLWLRYAPIESAGCAMLTGGRLPAWSFSSRQRPPPSSRTNWHAGSRGCLATRCQRGRRSPVTARSSSARSRRQSWLRSAGARSWGGWDRKGLSSDPRGSAAGVRWSSRPPATAARFTVPSICCACLRPVRRCDRLDVREKPRHQLRLLNHWDNLNGSIERGYAGPFAVELGRAAGADRSAAARLRARECVARPQRHGAQQRQRQRAVAHAPSTSARRPPSPTCFARTEYRSTSPPISPRRARSADWPTADPLDPAVRQWWKDKATEIYKAIPDFGGFLVKANSEGQPGPQDYKRTHADGANMLADAVKPHGGVVMWRAFVYDANVDPDRVKRAYMEFVPLDGTFRDNVFVQTKNGPLDFMPREPYHPVFGAMPKTPNIVELQITQEYLGHSTHLVYLAPMWKEFFDSDTFAEGAGIDCREGRRRHAAGPRAHRHRRRGQYRKRPQLDRTPFRRRELVCLRSAGMELFVDVGIHRRRVDCADVEPRPGCRHRDRDADARLARGVRELHDAARPASPDRRRSLRGDARERRQAAARLVGDSITTART